MLTLKDKLSRLTYVQACRLLGTQGEKMIMAGGKYDIDIPAQVTFTRDRFQLSMGEARVVVCLDPPRPSRLTVRCSACTQPCEHAGAALALILEEKMTLGLAAPPEEKKPIESLSEDELLALAVSERRERARSEKLRLTSTQPGVLWTDYVITNRTSGKTYRIALRGWKPGESYCTCPDYRTNTLGTCKHILYALEKVKTRFSKKIRQTPYRPADICVYLRHARKLELRLLLPEDLDPVVRRTLEPLQDRPVTDVHDLIRLIRLVERDGHDVTIYPDADEYIQMVLHREHLQDTVRTIRANPATHPLRKTLLKAELLPYQLDGIAFVAGVGRSVLADDMGLGKTIQGIGVAEMLAREAGIERVLVVCPASVKSQWRQETARFSDRSCQLVLGSARDRAEQYRDGTFFTICNYEQVLRDFKAIEAASWDLIILDEGQRIKNWEAKTSRTIKALKSPYALVLSGTPLENRLDELFSVVEFIDSRRLGPAFRFYNQHRVTDEKGRVLGYRQLDQLRERLKPIMLRRTRAMVLQDLPPRTTTIRSIPPTDEQLAMHGGHMLTVQTIVRKRYFTEMDFLRLQKALLMCRMTADSTFLVDKQAPGYSSKLQELDRLLDELMGEDDRKIIIFSEWTTMLNLIEPLLKKRGWNFVRLDGSVPQKKRPVLVQRFRTDPECKLFLTTNAGSTGLNLQAANTVINVDLPWNPAVLEQRIARAHRMGQKRHVQIYLLVTEDTLEENLLTTLSAKHELALAALDPDSEVTEVNLLSGIEEMKRRLEILLGAKPDAPLDESQKDAVTQQAAAHERTARVGKAGGQLIQAAFSFLGEMFPEPVDSNGKSAQMAALFRDHLSQCMEKGADGNLTMTISLLDESVIDTFAQTLARIAAAGTTQ